MTLQYDVVRDRGAPPQAPLADGLTDLSRHIARACASMCKALAENGVRLAVDADEAWLEVERCRRVELIVAELIRNAVRHSLAGGPGVVWVEVVESPGLVVCSVSDSGRNPLALGAGRGQGLVRAIAADLGGRISWRFSSLGWRARLEVPTTLRRPQ